MTSVLLVGSTSANALVIKVCNATGYFDEIENIEVTLFDGTATSENIVKTRIVDAKTWGKSIRIETEEPIEIILCKI
jgi:hypothetical protein